MGFSDDSDNDLPDWLSELGPDQDDQNIEYGDNSAFDPDEDKPDWISDDPSGGFDPSDEDEDDLPDWLAGIREKESNNVGTVPLPEIQSEEDDREKTDWLENIQHQFTDELGDQDLIPQEESDKDFLETIAALKAEDERPELPISDDQPTASLLDYDADNQEGAPEQKEPLDWISGLPEMDFEETPTDQRFDELDQSAEQAPALDWLKNIREDEVTDQDTSSEKAEETTEDSKVTASLPPWMETLQTSGLTLPAEPEEEQELNGAYYSHEEISALFEDDDLPDWLGSDLASDASPAADPDAAAQTSALIGDSVDQSIERAELPSWLQAISPFETAVSPTEEELSKVPKEGLTGEKERMGPLSGLSNVLPAEPHIINFGESPKATPGFELTDVQKRHTELLRSMVSAESATSPAKRRTVANPQNILRWLISFVLLTFIFATIWLRDSFALALPFSDGIPPENQAVISLVNELDVSDQVLVAVEYQPGLSGELEAASAALIQHLLHQDARIVLVSTQPTGPGLGEAFLQENFKADDYISTHQYANLGYVSGGAAGLLSFASNIRETKADMDWDQPPLNELHSIRDFSMVVVLTDDPDTARSWVEQVEPLLEDHVYLTDVPLVMVVSAQAEPLVYPYYYTYPQQIDGLISGIGGGAYYETVTGPGMAANFWTAYNVGLVLAVMIIAIGSIANLARNSLDGLSKGRS